MVLKLQKPDLCLYAPRTGRLVRKNKPTLRLSQSTLLRPSTRAQGFWHISYLASCVRRTMDFFSMVYRRGLGGPDEARVAESIAGLEGKLAAYESLLSKQKCLTGDRISLRDLSHFPYGTLVE
ncbi:uncharacterized protein TRUGW13939_01454, partial [Talaromyces rugulosus]